MFTFDVLYAALLISTTVMLSLDICEDNDTKLFVNDVDSVQFISTRIMQCKYNTRPVLYVIPWLFALIGPSTGFVFSTTLLKLIPEPELWSDVGIGCCMLSMTLGPILVVRFDESNLRGVYGKLYFEGFHDNPVVWHGAGVVLLLGGVIILNSLILHRLLEVRSRYSAMHALLTEYEFCIVLYFVVLVFFILTFIARQHFVAASLEYVLVGLVFIFVILSRRLYYSPSSVLSNVAANPSKAIEFRLRI